MNDFRKESLALKAAALAAVEGVIDSGWYILGPNVVRFEEEWSSYCGSRRAVGVANGMDAIEIALVAAGIGPGDEVVTTSMTAFATVLAILRCGATPVLADIEAGTGLLSMESVRRCLSPATRALVLVHLYGQIRNMQEWLDLCRETGLILIEDCAQAHGAEISGRMAGTFGRAGAYSFYPTKNLGAYGDAGALITDDEALAEKAAKIRNYGQERRYYHELIGLNSRLDEMQAALLRERLKLLPEYTARRREIASRYHAEVANKSLALLDRPSMPAAHSYHLFVLRADDRDALQSHLAGQEVESLVHYPVPIHEQTPTRHLRRDPAGLQVTEQHARTCLSIPCHPMMSEEEVGHVVAALNSFVAG